MVNKPTLDLSRSFLLTLYLILKFLFFSTVSNINRIKIIKQGIDLGYNVLFKYFPYMHYVWFTKDNLLNLFM